MSKPKAHVLTEQINALQQALRTHQEKCKHPERHRTYEYGSNTGNYDPGANCYWADYHCALCLKDWRVDQRNLVGKKR